MRHNNANRLAWLYGALILLGSALVALLQSSAS